MNQDEMEQDALTPPTAADSTNCNQQSSDCNNQANLGIKHPTAASGEKAFTIDPQWLLKMADAEDAVGGLAIGMSPFVSQPPSAPAAESKMETAWLLESTIAGSPVWYTPEHHSRRFTTDACKAMRFHTKTAAEDCANALGLVNWKATEHGFY